MLASVNIPIFSQPNCKMSATNQTECNIQYSWQIQVCIIEMVDSAYNLYHSKFNEFNAETTTKNKIVHWREMEKNSKMTHFGHTLWMRLQDDGNHCVCKCARVVIKFKTRMQWFHCLLEIFEPNHIETNVSLQKLYQKNAH